MNLDHYNKKEFRRLPVDATVSLQKSNRNIVAIQQMRERIDQEICYSIENPFKSIRKNWK
jgi:hypothetical protein